MNKAEEIRRLIINDLFLNMFDEDAEYTLERIDEYAAEVSRETIEECKKTLLKQLHPMIYRINTYPCEAVSKAVILSLDKLVKEQEEKC